MSILDGVKSMFGNGNREPPIEDTPIDKDKEGTLLFKDDIISMINEELERRKDEKAPLERQWRLNSNFLAGNQNCDTNIVRGEIEQVEPVYSWMSSTSYNRIAPLVETRIANIKKINYRMVVNPSTNEVDDYFKADVSTKLLQRLQAISDFDSKKNSMVLWNEICGSCYYLSWWDSGAGEVYGTKEDGENVREGEIDYGLLTPYEVFPEFINKVGIDNQRSIIIEQVMSVDEIYDLYNKMVEGEEIETFSLSPTNIAGGLGHEGMVNAIGHAKVSNSAKVITYFERKSRSYPNGRMAILIGDDLLFYGDLPYGAIPIVQITCKEVAGQFFGRSVIEDLIPIQRAYNGVLNRIHDHIKRISLGGYWAEEGSVDLDNIVDNMEPGAINTYRTGAKPPIPHVNGVMPSELLRERDVLKNDMEYTASVSQLMVIGATPQGVTAGTAIESLRDIDNTRLALTGDYIRNGVKNLAKLWLAIYKLYATNYRVVHAVGSNDVGGAIVWCNEDINSYDVEFTTENELYMSEDAQRERFFSAFQMGLFTDVNGAIPQRVKRKALECMKVGEYGDIISIDELQLQSASREAVMFEAGVMPQISLIDDDDIHIEEHKRYMLQMRFNYLKIKKPQLAQAFHWHFMEHLNRVQEKEMKMMEQMQMNNTKEE